MVLGVHHDERPVAARDRHDVEDLLVGEPQAVVGHIDLERAYALRDRRREIAPQGRLVRVRDDQVEGVVDDRLGAGTRSVVRKHCRHGIAAMLRAERHHRRRAAERRRHRRRVEIVGAHDAHRRQLLDVAMAVDAAGQHEPAAGVDLAPAGSERWAERCDALSLTPTSA